jgi:hypothetical protein
LNQFAYIYFNARVTAAIGKEHRAMWVFFSTLKRALGKKNHILKSEVKELSESLPYSYNTVRLHLEKLVKEGYAVHSQRGYILLSVKKVAAQKFDSKISFRYRYVVSTTKFELAARVSFLCFEESRRKQLHVCSKRLGMVDPKPKHIHRCLLEDERLTVSVRWVSKSIGNTSATTGSKIEKEWERLGLVKIKRSTSPVCKVGEFRAFCQQDPDAPSKCFVVGDTVYIRNVNQIRIAK